MGKRRPVLLVLHPRHWARPEYAGLTALDVHHVSIGGAVPKKLSGTPTFDGYAEATTEEGLRNLYAAANKLQPDFFLFWLHTGFHNEHLAEVRRLSPRTKMIFWFGNHRTRLAGNVVKIRKHVDALVLNSKEPSQFKLYRDYGIDKIGTLYDGFDPAEVPLEEVEPKYDCFFAGESYFFAQQRNEALTFPGTMARREFVIACSKRFSIACHSARRESWPFPTLREVYHPHHTAAMREARITLNVNHFPSFRQAYTRRTIRSIFARRCHVTLYIPGMEEDFTNHEHLVWFRDTREGVDLVARYLKDHEARERIAWAGWKLACEKFTFKQRLIGFEKDLRKWWPGAFK